MLAPACLLALAGLAPAAAPPAPGLVAQWRAGRRVEGVVFSPDGKRVFALDAGHAHVWDVGTSKRTHQAKATGAGVTHLTFDGASAGWVAGRSLWAWKLADQRDPVKRTTPRGTLPAEYSQATSPDGQTLAVVTPTDRRFRLVRLTQDRPDRVLLNLSAGYGHRVVFSPDGRLVALSNADGETVSVFATAGGEQVRRLMPTGGGRAGAPVVAFAPDGQSLLKCDRDARLVETMTGGERFRLRRLDAPVAIAWSRDGRLAARALVDSHVVVTDTFRGREIFDRDTSQKEITALAFSRDGARLATGGADATVFVWKVPAVERLKPDLPTTKAWQNLAESDATVGFKAIRSLVAGADESAKWLLERLKTRAAPDGKRIAQLIKELDDDDFDVRETASDELTQVGSPARAALEAALKSPPSPEVRRRCAVILGRLGGSSVAPGELRTARAVEVLEKVGSAEAKRALKTLLQSKPSAETESLVRSALSRLGDEG